ncbi:MAG: hypothetical protein CM1200mP18_13390 [Gammaproteobacteria bacterium]|nr:MAG: hypothetical protein CM1200mP18_13390 [Gammaproteobacteria bacterium]
MLTAGDLNKSGGPFNEAIRRSLFWYCVAAVLGMVRCSQPTVEGGEVKLIYWQAPSTMNPYLSGW